METDFKNIDDEKQMLFGIYFPVLRQYLMAKAIVGQAIANGQEVTQEDVRRMAEAVENEKDSTCPPSDEYLPVDEDDDYGPEKLSYTGLIEELEQDISEYEFFNNKMLIVWGYYAPLPDGEDVYVDFFYTDEDLDGNDDAPTIADFDQKVAEEYPRFLRKRMPARLLLKILKKQQEANQA